MSCFNNPLDKYVNLALFRLWFFRLHLQCCLSYCSQTFFFLLILSSKVFYCTKFKSELERQTSFFLSLSDVDGLLNSHLV